MRVLITSPSLDPKENVGGISTLIADLLQTRNSEFVHFVAGRRDGERSGLKWFVTQLGLPFAFRRAIRRSSPQVVHLNTSLEPRSIIRDLALAKSAGRLPVVVHINGGRFVLQDFPNQMLAFLADRLLRAASRVIVLSEAEASNILRRTPDASVTVLPNAIATEKFPDADRVAGSKNIIYLGRLHADKGLSDIVEACRLLKGQGFAFKFVCYGTGPDEEQFIREMNEVLGEEFHYGGVVAGSEKVDVLMAADIFLMPSKYEGLSLALLEAMAAGCVPVVSNCGSMPSVVEDGRNGFLIDPGNITQLVGKLKFLLSEGETGWAELRSNARKTIKEGYDINDFANKLEMIYREISEVDAN